MTAAYDVLCALNAKIKALGYNINGVTTFPRIEVHSIIETEGEQKDDADKVVSGYPSRRTL